MEQLVARYKQTTVSTNASRYSDKKILSTKKSVNESVSVRSSSSEDSIEVSSKKTTPMKQLEQRSKFQSVEKNSATKNSSNRIRQSEQMLPSNLIDQTITVIFKIFRSQYKHSIAEELRQALTDLSNQAQHDAQREIQQKLQQQEKQMHLLRMSQSSARDDTSRKLIIELENRLADSENQRHSVSQQKDVLSKKLHDLLQDVEKLTVRQDINERVQSENEILRRNNAALLQQIKQLQEKEQQQQIIWSQQVDDLIRMMDILKDQLQKSIN